MPPHASKPSVLSAPMPDGDMCHAIATMPEQSRRYAPPSPSEAVL